MKLEVDRKAKLGVIAGLLVIVALYFLLPAPAHATADPLVITKNTTLKADHVGKILIGADGVTLNCAGHNVTGDGTGIGINLINRTG